MAPTTFHPFSELPKELRDLIWDAAIRRDVPSAHFFTAWDGMHDASIFPNMVELSVAGRGVDHGVPCGLAAPRCNRAEPHCASWFDNNPSVYMEDSGLWTACKESREAMIRRFGNHRVTYQKGPLGKKAEAEYVKLPEFNDAPATGTMVQNGKTQYFTVCPKTDLFCLQPLAKGNGIWWKYFEEDVPIFNERGSPRPNIALELNPSWMDDYVSDKDQKENSAKPDEIHLPRYYFELGECSRDELGCAFYAATDLLGNWASKLWFIDYRIRPDPKRDPLGEDLDLKGWAIFQGRGCKYAEVGCAIDSGWIWGHDTPETSIHHFVERLKEKLEEYSEAHFASEWVTDPPRKNAPKIGVLACIPDGWKSPA
ncbi:hypothetical protein F5Y06DRAFT_272053 [Hypoxylon sp. FL0890]|nr:hypothetical protein F5Y06DRAFT_272053 [Hypoxylon sp. FL0890]